MTLNRIVVNDGDGANSYLSLRPYARAYAGYKNSTSETSTLMGVWGRFPASSVAWDVYRVQDFTIDQASCRFTYTGSTTRWFRINATCNILKGSGAAIDRRANFQWRLNGNPIGPVRDTHMNNKQSEIVAGSGQVSLTTGDYIEPWIMNADNDDKIRLFNCYFDIVEEPDSVFIWE